MVGTEVLLCDIYRNIARCFIIIQVAMLIRQVRYGIDLGLSTVSISPFGPTNFSYHVGNVFVAYNSPSAVRLCLPGSGSRVYTVTGLMPSATYSVNVEAGVPQAGPVSDIDEVVPPHVVTR